MTPRTMVTIALPVLVIATLWMLGSILTPFLVGAGLAYICDPMVDRLERVGLSRTSGVIVVFAGVTLVFVLLLVSAGAA